MTPLLRFDEEFYEAILMDRPNRYTLRVNLNGILKKAYLANPGGLSTVIAKDREVLLLRKEQAHRKTQFDVFAIKINQLYVTVQSTLANRVFEATVNNGLIQDFVDCRIVGKEKLVEGYGRVDFLLKKNGKIVFVEVKSCTHVEDGLARFPDRPTERGRKHVKKLIELKRKNAECYLIFVIQRPDAEKFTPFKEIDEEFANLVKEAANSGVNVRALKTEFKHHTSTIYLVNTSIPVVL